MKLIIDTNRIIAALVKEGFTRKAILFSDLELLSPEFSMGEVNKYKNLILEKSQITEKEFKMLFSTILERINIIKKSDYESYLKEADLLIGKIDQSDIPFIALALSLNNDGIWSDDTHFDKQNKIKVWKTKDIYDCISFDLE